MRVCSESTPDVLRLPLTCYGCLKHFSRSRFSNEPADLHSYLANPSFDVRRAPNWKRLPDQGRPIDVFERLMRKSFDSSLFDNTDITTGPRIKPLHCPPDYFISAVRLERRHTKLHLGVHRPKASVKPMVIGQVITVRFD